MENKGKVTKIMKMDKLDQYGNTSYVVEFDNGDKGYYTSKDADQKKFIVGNVADYILEEKIGSKGPYNKIRIAQEEQRSFGGFQKKSVDPKVQLIGFAGSYAKDLIVSGKVTPEGFEVTFDRIFNKMISKL